MRSEIREYNGTLRVFVDGEPLITNAYIAYHTHKARYSDFAEMGYKLFSVPLIFSSKPFNEISQAPCYSKAIFDNEVPDFAVVDEEIGRIIDACPDALIFPRVNVSLPERWEIANTDELCDTGKAEIHRPCFSSDKWFEDTKVYLKTLIDYISTKDYSDHIIGYQLASGNTEEWFSFDLVGSIGKRSREKFVEYREKFGYEDTEADYYAFLSQIVADRICGLAKYTKEITNSELLVGTFYGYTFECPARTSCHHALKTVLECPDIDFICSPVSYNANRALGRDHGCMLPCDSLRHHGKLYFAENDTRTHLAIPPYQHLEYFRNPVFNPKEFGEAVEAMKIHYARALVHGYALWWFDMWGGWFADPTYKSMLTSFLEITKQADKKKMGSVSELAVFIDEGAFKYPEGTSCGPGTAYLIREALGKIGTPYDCFLATDFDAVKDNYKAYVLLEPCKTELSEYIKADAAKTNKGCYVVDKETYRVSPEALRSFCKDNGIHLYCDRDAVVYVNESYLFIHTCSEGKLEITMPEGKKLSPLFANLEEGAVYPEKYGCLFEII